jgi:DNA-binding SARP family transcriptional activator
VTPRPYRVTGGERSIEERCVSGATVNLHLLNGPYALVAGQRHAVPEGSKRLLVLMAIRRCLTRRAVATMLWPGVEPRRAAGNLRSAAWRLRCAGIDVLVVHDEVLRVRSDVTIDIELLRARAERLVAGRGIASDLDMLPVAAQAVDLLPGWYEDWVSDERARLHSFMLTAIDALSVQLCRAGRFAEAIDAALVAVTVDPLRRSSHTALIDAHLAEGNIAEAHRAETSYRNLLGAELLAVPRPTRPSMRYPTAAAAGHACRATGSAPRRLDAPTKRPATNSVS